MTIHSPKFNTISGSTANRTAVVPVVTRERAVETRPNDIRSMLRCCTRTFVKLGFECAIYTSILRTPINNLTGFNYDSTCVYTRCNRSRYLESIGHVPSWSPWIISCTTAPGNLFKFDGTSIRCQKTVTVSSYRRSTLRACRSLHGTTALRKCQSKFLQSDRFYIPQ